MSTPSDPRSGGHQPDDQSGSASPSEGSGQQEQYGQQQPYPQPGQYGQQPYGPPGQYQFWVKSASGAGYFDLFVRKP